YLCARIDCMKASIADLRSEYSSQTLLEQDVAADPVVQFEKWWHQAIEAEIEEPNAMTLATASVDGLPSARIVLLKGFDRKGFIFFTNYRSYKGRQLEENPKACLVFFWKELERQVRIVGLVNPLGPEESDDYFHSRPVGSQLGALTSPQSEVISGREWLDEQYREMEAQFRGKAIERPAYWGGYRVQPVIVEFWQGRPSRLHDRIQYSLQEGGDWKIERLAP
ncbi:MAG: pyridoxamine 5'-phosphate oxidase, partial [Flavisolibacter sp.]